MAIPFTDISLLLLLLLLHYPTTQATNPWDKFNLSPASRTLTPTSLYNNSNNDNNSTTPTSTPVSYPIQLQGVGADVVFDFGLEVGGYTTVHFGKVTGSNVSVTFYWSESSLYVATGDASNGGGTPDGGLNSGLLSGDKSSWTAQGGDLRGGFRYLRVVINGGSGGGGSSSAAAAVTITGVSLYFTASPHVKNLRDWKSHFYSSDNLLNQIWYACGYTVQLCSISSTHGRQWPPPTTPGWANNATCGEGVSVLVDGAKRDRTVWPGDMGVSTATAFATTGDTYSSRMSLEILFAHQSPDGMLPYAGPPVSFYDMSDTYV